MLRARNQELPLRPHGGFMGANAPEDAEIIAECRSFINSAWGIE
jgi:hypothetical protein